MKRQVVRFCSGCGQVFDDVQPEGGQGRWIEARVYLMKYGFTWDDLTLVNDACPPCKRVLTCARNAAVSAPESEKEAARSS
jgi:hypothetical protein